MRMCIWPFVYDSLTTISIRALETCIQDCLVSLDIRQTEICRDGPFDYDHTINVCQCYLLSISSKFSRNSEANASELRENLEEMFPVKHP